MSKSIKTKEAVKDIKIHDSAVNVSGRIKDIGVKTKDKVAENISQTDAGSPEQFASDKITASAKTVAEDVGYASENAVNKAVNKGAEKAKEKIKEHKAEKQTIKERELDEAYTPDNPLNENPEPLNDSDNTDKKPDKRGNLSKHILLEDDLLV